jgi:hypothetical protein
MTAGPPKSVLCVYPFASVAKKGCLSGHPFSFVYEKEHVENRHNQKWSNGKYAECSSRHGICWYDNSYSFYVHIPHTFAER